MFCLKVALISLFTSTYCVRPSLLEHHLLFLMWVFQCNIHLLLSSCCAGGNQYSHEEFNEGMVTSSACSISKIYRNVCFEQFISPEVLSCCWVLACDKVQAIETPRKMSQLLYNLSTFLPCFYQMSSSTEIYKVAQHEQKLRKSSTSNFYGLSNSRYSSTGALAFSWLLHQHDFAF